VQARISSVRRGFTALLALAAAATLMLTAGQSAEASTSVYCGNQTLSPWAPCTGTHRTLNAVYGWGDQAGVCVSASIAGNLAQGACTGQAGAGAYKTFPGYYDAVPWIQNSSGKTNTVHGVAYQP